MKLLQMGQQSGRYELAPMGEGEAQVSPSLWQRLAGGSPYAAQGGFPVLPFGGGAIGLKKIPTLGESLLGGGAGVAPAMPGAATPATSPPTPGGGTAPGVEDFDSDPITATILSRMPDTPENRLAFAKYRETLTKDRALKTQRLFDRKQKAVEAARSFVPQTPEDQALQRQVIQEIHGARSEHAISQAELKLPLDTPVEVMVGGKPMMLPRKEAAPILQKQAEDKVPKTIDHALLKYFNNDPTKALEAKDAITHHPTLVDLAMKAAHGTPEEQADAKETLKYAKPRDGFAIEFGPDGNIVTLSTGEATEGFAGRIPNTVIAAATLTMTATTQALKMYDEVELILRENPTAAGFSGRTQVAVTNLANNILNTVQPKTAQDRLVADEMAGLKNADASKLDYLLTALYFRQAIINNNGDSRISDNDFKAAQAMYGGKYGTAQDILPRIKIARDVTMSFRQAARNQLNIKETDPFERPGPGLGERSDTPKAAPQTVTEAQVQDVMKSRGKSRAEVLKALKTQGFTLEKK